MDDATKNAEDLIAQIKDSTDTFRRHQCRHTMPEGGRCGSPAMNGEKFCYHHHQTRRPIADARQRRARRNAFDMPTPNSRAEIQDSLGRIIAHVAGNDIDLRRAGLLLYALQLASTNLTEHQRHIKSPKQTLSTEPEPAVQPEHPHYGTGPRPQFAPNGEPISTIQPTTEPSQDSAPDFTPPPAKWHRLQQGTGRLLLEQLGRHHSKDNPLPGTPEDRRDTADEVSFQPEGPTHDVSSRPELSPTRDVSFRPEPRSGAVEKPASPPLTSDEPEALTIQAVATTHELVICSAQSETIEYASHLCRPAGCHTAWRWSRVRPGRRRQDRGRAGSERNSSGYSCNRLLNSCLDARIGRRAYPHQRTGPNRMGRIRDSNASCGSRGIYCSCRHAAELSSGNDDGCRSGS
jgi:hypothetical protein